MDLLTIWPDLVDQCGEEQDGLMDPAYGVMNQTAVTADESEEEDGGGVERHSLSELEYWTFASLPPMTGMERILNLLEGFLEKEKKWDLRDGHEVESFHSGLVDAATRWDRPFHPVTQWVIPDQIVDSFRKLYTELFYENNAAYVSVIQFPGIESMFHHMISTAETPVSLTTGIYTMDVTYVNLLNLYLVQKTTNESFLTQDFVRQLCLSAMTLLLEYKSADMSEFLPGFVEHKRPALKIFVRNVVNGCYADHLTTWHRDNVDRHLHLWFHFDGAMAEENALSLELDVIEKDLRQVLQMCSQTMQQEKEDREVERAEKKAAAAARKEAKAAAAVARGRSSESPAARRRPPKCEKREDCKTAKDWPNVITKRVKILGRNMILHHCPKCPFTRPGAPEMDRHLRHHGLEAEYQCTRCDFSCHVHKGLHRHQRIHDSRALVPVVGTSDAAAGVKTDPDTSSVRVKRERYECPGCPATFSRSDSLKWHLLHHESGFKHRCLHCDYGTNDEPHLRRHMDMHSFSGRAIAGDEMLAEEEGEEGEEVVQSNNKLKLEVGEAIREMEEKATISMLFRCFRCPAQFVTVGELDRHVQRHGARGTFRCRYNPCDYTAMNPTARNRHEDVHHEQVPVSSFQ